VTAVASLARTDRPSADRRSDAAVPTLPAVVGLGDDPAPLPAPVVPGVVAARYQILEPLGAGGDGTVWLAHDRVLGRRVALKHLDASRTSGRARALREARAAARVAHPNIVGVHDVIVDRGERAWIVMEALTGVSLAVRAVDEGGLPVASVHRIAEALVAALDTLHAAGVVHRDVKPSNIHLGADGRVVLTDFGVAAPLERSQSGQALLTGTLGYIAPESVLSGIYSARSDLYALGAALWFAVEGALPFGIRSIEDLIEHASAGVDPPPIERAMWLEPVITGLLQARPADRWTAARAKTYLRKHRPRRAARRWDG
jgi:eukaryotic-like serine/threonine-protein kinase